MPLNAETRRPAGGDAHFDTTSVTRRERIFRVAARRPSWGPNTANRSHYCLTRYDARATAARLVDAGWLVSIAVSDVTVRFTPAVELEPRTKP